MAWAPRLPASVVLLTPASALIDRARRTRRDAAGTVEGSRAVLAHATLAMRHALALRGQVPCLRVAPGVAFATAGDGAVDGSAGARLPRWAASLPPRPAFTVAENLDGGVTTVIVTGEVDLATAPDVQRCLEAHAGAPRLVVDLSGVRFLDSCGMAVLVRAMRRAAESGQDLALRAPAEAAVLRALDITGLLTALPFEPAGQH